MTLLDPPLQFMRSLLWELYELNFRHELYALDRALVPHLWASDQACLARQALLSGVFPGNLWSEPDIPQEWNQMGMCTSDMATVLPFVNQFRDMLSVWPGAPDRLKFPVELDGRANTAVYDTFLLAAQFYVQTAFDYLGRQPSLPRIHSVS